MGEVKGGIRNRNQTTDITKEDGIFLLIDSVNRENALIIQRDGRVTYVDTSTGVGLSELMKIRRMKPSHVYRLDELFNENHINTLVLQALEKARNSPVPVGIFANYKDFQFDVGIQNGRVIWANAYYKGNHIIGYTALRLLLSSRADQVDYHEAMEPSVKIIDLPLEDILAVFRLPEVKIEEPREEEAPARRPRIMPGRFQRIVNGLSIVEAEWKEYVDYFVKKGFSGALTSSKGHIVILKAGRIEREDRLDLPYECEFFRVWALEFEGDYSIEGGRIILGSVSLNLPHFLISAEMDGVEGSFFLFAGFDYTPSINSELFVLWRKAFASFFDDLAIVDFDGMDWIIVRTDRVLRFPPQEVLRKYAYKIIFVGEAPIPAEHVLPAESDISSILLSLRKVASSDQKRDRINLCYEIRRLIERLKSQIISWPIEVVKIKTVTGIDPMKLDSCEEEDLQKLKDFLAENYGIA